MARSSKHRGVVSTRSTSSTAASTTSRSMALTYYVTADREDVLVHNSDPCDLDDACGTRWTLSTLPGATPASRKVASPRAAGQEEPEITPADVDYLFSLVPRSLGEDWIKEYV